MTEQPKAVIYMGAAGSGKGRNSSRLAENKGFARLEMGEHLRHLKATSKDPAILTELALMDNGGLVRDDFVVEQATKWIRNAHGPIILDGVIRSKPQFDAIIPVLKELGYDIIAVWFITRPKVCYDRILSGNRGRSDDHRAAIVKRLHTYVSEIRHLKKYFEDARILIISVDNSNMTEDETYTQVMKWLYPGIQVADETVARTAMATC